MGSIVKREWLDNVGARQIRNDAYVAKRGHKKQVKTFRRMDMAQRWMRLVEAELEKGAFKCTAAAERMTLREAMHRYVDEVVPTKRVRFAEQQAQQYLSQFERERGGCWRALNVGHEGVRTKSWTI